MHAFNPSTQEAEAGGYLWVWGQPDLQSELVLGQPGLRKPVSPPQKKPTKNKQKANSQTLFYVCFLCFACMRTRCVHMYLVRIHAHTLEEGIPGN